MTSSALISGVALVGLVVLGVVFTLLFYCVYKRGRSNPSDLFYTPRYQLRAQSEQLKPRHVLSEHELALLPIRVLATKELYDPTSAVAAADSHLVNIDEQQKRYFAQDCGICLEEYRALDVVRMLSCGHYFHQPCIDDWLTNHNVNCPICKASMAAALNQPPPSSEVAKQSNADLRRQPSYEVLVNIRPPPRALTATREARGI